MIYYRHHKLGLHWLPKGPDCLGLAPEVDSSPNSSGTADSSVAVKVIQGICDFLALALQCDESYRQKVLNSKRLLKSPAIKLPIQMQQKFDCEVVRLNLMSKRDVSGV